MFYVIFERLKDTVNPMNSELLPILKDLSVIKRLPLLGGSLTKIFTFRTKHFVHYLRCPQLASFTVLLTSESCFFKTKFVTGYYEIDTIAKQSSFSSFSMVENNPSNSSVSFEIAFFFFSGIAEASNFLSYFVGKEKV